MADPTGALMIVRGSLSNGATWDADYTFSLKNSTGGEVADTYKSDAFRFQFRKDRHSSATDLVVSSTAIVALTTNSDHTLTVGVNAGTTTLAPLCGDYFLDIASKSTAGTITHWAHGLVTIIDEPIAW